MMDMRRFLPILLLAAAPLAPVAALAAQSTTPAPAAPADTTTPADTAAQESDDEGIRLGLQFGVTTGALHFEDGRSEQAAGAIVRWAPLHWLAFTANPAGVHATVPASAGGPAVSRTGLVDLPVAALVSHKFDAPYTPVLTGGLGLTLPIGDQATGFGSGQVGSEVNMGLGISPTDNLWMNFGVGHSLSSFAAQSSFSGGSSWGDAEAGTSITERLSVNGGYSSDLGTVDPTIGRSTSISGGFGYVLDGPLSLNVSATHGLSGIAPTWSLALGIGTAFSPLAHREPGQLRKTFGGGGAGGGNPGIGRRP